MTIKTLCPHCHEVAFDATTGECSACHMRGGAIDPAVIDDTMLDDLLHNARRVVSALRSGEFVQLLGAFGPRAGYPADDGIPFDADSVAIVFQYFQDHDIPCLWLAVTADYSTTHSIVLAQDARGLNRGLRAARKAVRQIRARLEVRGRATTD